MNEYTPKLMKDDPLQILIDLMGYKIERKYLPIIRIIACGLAIFSITFMILAVVKDSYNGNLMDIVTYSPSVLLQLQGATVLFGVILHREKLFLEHEDIFRYFWSALGNGTKKVVLQERNRGFAICTVLAILLLSNVIPLTFGNTENISKVICPIGFFRKSFGEWSEVLVFVHYTSMWAQVIASVSIPLSVVYLVYGTKIQFRLLRAYIEKELNAASDDLGPGNRLEYQNIVYKKLLNCAQHHANMRKLVKNMITCTEMPVLVLSILGVINGAAIIYFLMANLHPSSNFRIITMFVSSTSAAVFLCVCGQMTRDESELLYHTVLDCPWYYWNLKNRRAYLILLMFSLKPSTLKCFGIGEVDYPYLLSIVRNIYSLATVFIKFK